MLLTGTDDVFLMGFMGGMILEITHWYNIRKRGRLPKYAQSIKYWIITLVMASAGGLLAVLYFGNRAEGIIALHVGLSAPLILQKLTTTLANVSGGKSNEVGILDFFKW